MICSAVPEEQELHVFNLPMHTQNVSLKKEGIPNVDNDTTVLMASLISSLSKMWYIFFPFHNFDLW